MIIGIVAIAKNYAIGKDGKLPWHYPADLKFFKETTTGHAIVMGSRTWTSIGRPLPGRMNIVLSRSGVDAPPEVLKLVSADEVIDLSQYLNRDVFIIGGAETYKAFADSIEEWLVTEVPETIEDADTFFPRELLDGFEEYERLELEGGLKVKKLRRK